MASSLQTSSWSHHNRLAFVFLIWASTCLMVWSQRAMSNRISIGFVYCEPEELLRAEQVVAMLNKEPSQRPIFIDLKSHQLSLADNTLSMSLTVCKELMGKTPLYAVMIARTDCIKVSI